MKYLRVLFAIVICTMFVHGDEHPTPPDSARVGTAINTAKEYVARGDVYRERGDNDSAIAEYNEAIRLDPANAEAYNNRGIAYVNKGCYRLTVANYAKAFWLDPIKYWYFLCLVFLVIWIIWFVYFIVKAVIGIINALIKFKKERNKMQYLWGIVKNIPWYLWRIVIGILFFILCGIIILEIAVNVIYSHAYFFPVVLIISVFIHELSRLVAAKLCKIQADVFAVGFGPTLLKWKRGGTEYRVNAVPICCYVKMAGNDPNGKDRGAVNEYNSKPIWQRAIVALSGPAANVIVAFFALWTMCFWGLDHYIYLDSAPRIGLVRLGSPADSAGFSVGDSIISISGSPVATWDQVCDQMDTLLYKQQRDDYKVVVLRDGKPIEFGLPVKRTGKSISGALTDWVCPASVPAVVGTVKPKSGADGVLKVGDTILAFNGAPVSHIEEVYNLMYSKRTPKGDSAAVAFDIKRGEVLMRVVVVPKYVSKDDSENGYSYYSLGIKSVPEPTRIERDGAIGALHYALRKAWECSTTLFDMINCITSENGECRKSAPSMIGNMTFDPRDILYAMGFIGMNLAMVSLLINAGLLINSKLKTAFGK